MEKTLFRKRITWESLLATLVMIALVFVVGLSFSVDKAYGAEDPAVTIVNPLNNTTVYSNSILISIKLTAPETIKVNVYKQVKHDAKGNPSTVTFGEWEKNQEELKAIAAGTSSFTNPSIQVLQGWVTETVSFTSTSDLAFFTKKVENLSNGVYRIRIDTIDNDDKVIFKIGRAHV